MEASLRLNRHLSLSFLSRHSLRFPSNASSTPLPAITFRNRSVSLRIRSSSCSGFSSSFRSSNSNPLGLFLSLASAQFSNTRASDERCDRVVADSKESVFVWHRAPREVTSADFGFIRDRGPVFTVVVLGWLGSEQKHLRRYVELYNSRGIHAVTFVNPVRDVLGFDWGRKAEQRLLALAQEIISWLSEREEDGRERCLLFHTFSNAGWLSYGSILKNLQCRDDLIEKIKGCVVDSGPDPNLNSQVWAAGFTTAILKQRSSSTVSVIEGQKSGSSKSLAKKQEKYPSFLEMALFFVLEKFFSVILMLPDVNQVPIVSLCVNKNDPYLRERRL